MFRPLSSEFSILLSDVKSQLAGRTKASHGPRVIFSEAYQFQSTAPVWGPTMTTRELEKAIRDFNPRPPCGGRRYDKLDAMTVKYISIHGPRVGADSTSGQYAQTPLTISIHGPRVGADAHCSVQAVLPEISIHGPRVGADVLAGGRVVAVPDFNPRPPCGGRRRSPRSRRHGGDFNPRPPCGGRRSAVRPVHCGPWISIHGPRVGADASSRLVHLYWLGHFNPRPPCGGRPVTCSSPSRASRFQSTAPVWGPTSNLTTVLTYPTDFNPRPPCGGRRAIPTTGNKVIGNFNPRPPCGGRPEIYAGSATYDEFQSTAPV